MNKTIKIYISVFIILLLAEAHFILGFQENPNTTSSEKQEPLTQKLEKVNVLLKQGSNIDAENLAREILEEVGNEHGADSLQTAQVIDVLVESIIINKKQVDDEVRALMERATSIREKILGPNHADIAQSLYRFARLHWKNGDYAGSKPYAERAVAVAEEAYGPEHDEVGKILFTYAFIYNRTADYARAKEIYDKALQIREKELGSESIEVSEILNNQGLCYKELGNFEEARSCFERTLAIREKVLGPEHIQTAFAADNLAGLLHTMGVYGEAKSLLERVVPILEKEYGPEHPRTAAGWNDLGYLLKDMGEFSSSIKCHERALAIREKAFGPDHPAVAYSLNNIAVVFRRIGDYERARKYLERGLAICEKEFGPNHPNVAMLLMNLANSFASDEEAEPYYKRAFEIQEKTLGPDNVRLSPYLVNYAVTLRKLGNFEKALEFQMRALDIQEKNLGPNHPDISTILINLASLYHDKGDDTKAISAMERAQGITERAAGPEHPFMAKILLNYAKFLWHDGKTALAFENALRSEEITRNHLRLIAKSLSEQEALAFAYEYALLGFDTALSVAADSSKENKDTVSRAWDAYIRSRAVVLDEMATRHRTFAEIQDPAAVAAVEDLVFARQQLSDLIVRGPESETSKEEFQQLLDKAKNDKELAERVLADLSSSFQREMEAQKAGLDEVRTSLPPGFALVAFAYYYYGGNDGIPSYLAFILADKNKEPIIVPLGKEEEILPLIMDWAQETDGGTRIPGRTADEAETAYRSSGEALRKKIWDPIAPHIRQAKCVLLVPEGSLHILNFAALPFGTDQYLIEGGTPIHYLSAERDIISNESPVIATGLLALGAPDFNTTSLFAALSPEDNARESLLSKVKSLVTFRGKLSGCEDLKSLEFSPLPATDKEVNMITDIWKKDQENKGDVLELTDAMANEGTFKVMAPGKHTIHLATHGFLLGRNCPSGENPLLSSGLAFAGANHREIAGPEEDDGILTAEEVANLDLLGTDLAILSACASAAGEIMGGEGVFGLQRAFRVAGVQTLIMSLWAVEDNATRIWMEKLYQSRFSQGKTIAESVHLASLEMLLELKKKEKHTSVLLGGICGFR